MAKQKDENEVRRKAAHAAYLSVEEQMTQTEIGDILGVKQAEVSRLLKDAKDKAKYHFIRTSLQLGDDLDPKDFSAIKPAEKDRLRKYLYDKSLAAGDGVPLEEVYVHNSGSAKEKSDRLKRFAENSANDLVKLISDSVALCGVSWGRTVSETVAAVCNLKPESRENIRFVPVAGERWNDPEVGISPSVAAAKLAESFKMKSEVLSLRGIPARIPKALDKEAKTIREFLKNSTAFEELFVGTPDGKPCLMDEMQCFITSVGDTASADSENDPWFKETMNAEGMESPDELRQIAIGNMAGVWFHKSEDNARAIEAINGRWLGINDQQIRNCAKRGASKQEKSPGVIILAVGEAKAEVVLRALGRVNHLFIDQLLANAILDGMPAAN